MTETKVVKKVPCAVFSRVVGFYAEVRNWNIGKRQEWQDRKEYDVPESVRRGS